VSAPSGCTWTARTDVSWADVGPGSGSGDGSLVLAFTENEGRSTRSLSLTINGTTARVVQNGRPCTYSVNPSAIELNNDSTGASIVLTTLDGCAWTASSNQDWIRPVPASASGSGSATVQFDVQSNGGSQRTAVLTIGGLRIDVTQRGR
jgi:hypothetical protein